MKTDRVSVLARTRAGVVLRNRGMTLVELLVAATIGLLLIAALGYSYIGTRGTFRAQEAQARKAENGRVALDIITRDLRESARMGCTQTDVLPGKPVATGPSNIEIRANFPVMEGDAAALSQEGLRVADVKPGPAGPIVTSTLSAHRLVTSFEKGVGFNKPAGGLYSPRNNTDVLRIVKAGESGSHLAQAMVDKKSGLPDIFLQSVVPGASPGSSAQQLFVITDCIDTEIIRAQVNSSGPGAGGKLDYGPGLNSGNQLKKNYGANAYVARFSPAIYLVADPPTSSQVTNPVLYRYSLVSTGAGGGAWGKDGEIVADGIEDLQIRFGEVTDGGISPNRYVTSNAVSDWSNVVSVEVTLVAISKEDNVGVVTATNQAGGTDRRFRQSYTAIVQLKNRQKT